MYIARFVSIYIVIYLAIYISIRHFTAPWTNWSAMRFATMTATIIGSTKCTSFAISIRITSSENVSRDTPAKNADAPRSAKIPGGRHSLEGTPGVLNFQAWSVRHR